jgi:hypothetical protein
VLAASDIVRDSIVERITLGQNAAGMVTVTVDEALDRRTRLGLSFSVLRADLMRQFDTAQATTLTRVTMLNPAVVLTRALSVNFAVSVKGLLIAYRPRTTSGTPFQDDKPLRPGAGVGLHLMKPVGSRVTIGADLSYDVHGFTTRALRGDGIDQRLVHRVSIGAAIRRSYGQVEP